MTFSEFPQHWQRVFTLEWESLCKGSKAIAAVITDEAGCVISEGRNMTGETAIPNPAAMHAETEAVRNLDVRRYPDKHSYTLYAGLEPCVMCMGTIVMGGIRKVEIAARDDFGGAMQLLNGTPFLRSKQMQVIWRDDLLGDVQRGLQTVRELLYNSDSAKLERMLTDFSVYNKAGTAAAKALCSEGVFRNPSAMTAEEAVNVLLQKIES